MKWWKGPLGRNEVSPHLVKLFARSEARGIFISSYGYTEPAVTTCKDALPLKTVVLCSLDEIVQVLEAQASFKDLLKDKIRAAVIDKNPLHRRAS
jgi:restriction system protein